MVYLRLGIQQHIILHDTQKEPAKTRFHYWEVNFIAIRKCQFVSLFFLFFLFYTFYLEWWWSRMCAESMFAFYNRYQCISRMQCVYFKAFNEQVS